MRLVLGAILLCFFAGCGRGPDLAPVEGKVTWKGKGPGFDGQITFQPVDGRRPAVGHLKADGVYKLTTFREGDGALVGEHRVMISVSRIDKADSSVKPKDLSEEGSYVHGKLVWVLPEQYSDEKKSGLTATVKRGSKNEIDFSLP